MKAVEHLETGSHFLKGLSGQNAFVKLLKAFPRNPGLIRTATELRDIKVSADVFEGGGNR